VTEDVLAESHQTFQVHSRSFSLAARFLPAPCRDDAAVVYAFCRMVDDLADEGGDAEAATLQLDALTTELQGQAPPRPLVAAVLDITSRRNIDIDIAAALIEGCRSDLHKVQMCDQAALLRYCYQVAGTVGLMMCGVLGVTDPKALPFAIDLGVGMQLTNICRDVAEDAARGRIYLPIDQLQAYGVAPEALLTGQASREGVAQTVCAMLSVADVYYDSAWSGLHYIPGRARLAIRIAGWVYRAIGHRLRGAGCDALAGRTVVPWTAKTSLVARASLQHLWTSLYMSSVEHDASLHAAIVDLPGANRPDNVLRPASASGHQV